MKRNLIAILIAVLSLQAWGSNQFVGKDYEYEMLVLKYRTSIILNFTNLFEYPDEIPQNADFRDEQYGVSYDIEFLDDNSPLSLYKYDCDTKSFKVAIYVASRRYGNFNCKVKLTYNGETIESIVTVSTKAVIAKDDEVSVAPGQQVIVDALLNDNFADTSAKKDLSLLSLDNIDVFPTLGTLSMTEVDGRPAFEYTSDRDAVTFSKDEFQFHYDITYDGNIERVVSKCTVDLHGKMYATRVIDYLPAPGQFTNTWNFGTADKEKQEEQTCNGKGQGLSLGSFGGYIIFGFDQPIYNNPQNPYGVDFTVLGNAFRGNLYGYWSEPAAVQVMEDKNGNGIPDDGEWYELAGSDYWLSTTRKNLEMTYYNPHYNKRYTVPFSTNQDLVGGLMSNHFHEQPYYPDPFEFGCDRDQLTYSGNMIKSSPDKRAPSYIEFYRCPAFGYADNHATSNSDPTNPLNPYYNDENGNVQDGFDLSWAIDKDGNHVELEKIDFVKVYNAGWANLGWLGEWSAECLGVAISRPDADYEPQDYYLNYIGITQLLIQEGKEVKYDGLAFRNGIPMTEGQAHWWVPEEYSEIISVNDEGLVKGLKTGEATLYFQQTELAPADSINLLVVDIVNVIIDQEGNTGVASNTRTELLVGERVYINAEDEFATDEDLNGQKRNRYTYEEYDWESSNPEIGTIENGLFTGLKEGESTVTVRSRIKQELYAEMLMVVNPIPDVIQAATTFGVAEDDPTGSFGNDELFDNGLEATVYITSVTPDNLEHSLIFQQGNALGYNFMPNEFVTDSVTVGWEFRGKHGEFRYLLRYDEGTEQSGAEGEIKLDVNSGEWSTLCLPYDISNVRNVTLYTIAGHDKYYSKLLLSPIGNELKAGTPCIYHANAATLRASLGEGTSDEAYSLNGLYGTFEDITAPEGTWTVGPEEISDSSKTTTIQANNAYILIDEIPELEDYDTSMPYIDMNVSKTLGIGRINMAQERLIYYDLYGNRLPYAQKGLNIVRYPNGTSVKIFVK